MLQLGTKVLQVQATYYDSRQYIIVKFKINNVPFLTGRPAVKPQ